MADCGPGADTPEAAGVNEAGNRGIVSVRLSRLVDEASGQYASDGAGGAVKNILLARESRRTDTGNMPA